MYWLHCVLWFWQSCIGLQQAAFGTYGLKGKYILHIINYSDIFNVIFVFEGLSLVFQVFYFFIMELEVGIYAKSIVVQKKKRQPDSSQCLDKSMKHLKPLMKTFLPNNTITKLWVFLPMLSYTKMTWKIFQIMIHFAILKK